MRRTVPRLYVSSRQWGEVGVCIGSGLSRGSRWLLAWIAGELAQVVTKLVTHAPEQS